MRIASAIFAVAKKFEYEAARRAIDAWTARAAELEALGANTARRVASMIGQCSHESGGFERLEENLWYRAARLREIWPTHFPTDAIAAEHAGKPERIANRAYADRMKNGDEASGDGWRYRGRGYIQLTGRENYQTYGRLQAADLEANPGAARDPELAWLIAANYYRVRHRNGRSLFEWADRRDHEQVTRGINGGTHGLVDRIMLSGQALKALNGNLVAPMEKQVLLAGAGFDPRGIDGAWGQNSKRAERRAEAATGKRGMALWQELRTMQA